MGMWNVLNGHLKEERKENCMDFVQENGIVMNDGL